MALVYEAGFRAGAAADKIPGRGKNPTAVLGYRRGAAARQELHDRLKGASGAKMSRDQWRSVMRGKGGAGPGAVMAEEALEAMRESRAWE